MKIAIPRFPSTNNELDALKIFKDVFKVNSEIIPHFNFEKIYDKAFNGIFIPGGFSYGDYLRCGAIAAVSEMMDAIKIKNNEDHIPVLGICNGFQILTEAGLLPGVLLKNLSTRFISKWVNLLPSSKSNPLTRNIDKKSLKLPIAHFEGRYWIEENKFFSFEENNQIIAQYCTSDGDITSESNPNGSMYNIAGVSNKNQTIFGMMPHPERASRLENQSVDGLYFIKNFIDLIKSNR